jgi:DNA helicase HerA-like ATPase
VQLYFEEAHNLFPKDSDNRGMSIYSKIAKEGAKYHIGMVYSTQSVTSIDTDLVNQTENFFIAHLSSQDEVKALSRVNASYDGLQDDILRAKTKGYIQMLTRSHRFVVPVQTRIFQPLKRTESNDNLRTS